MDKMLLLCSALSLFPSCPPPAPEYEPPRASTMSYCSGGQLWYPGHSAPSGNCDEPLRVLERGDMA